MKKAIFFILALFTSINFIFSQDISVVVNEQTKLIDEVKNDFLSITVMIDSLKEKNEYLTENNKNLTMYCEESMHKILKLEENIIMLKSALNSNREDESIVIQELGVLSEELNNYKEFIASVEKRLKNSEIFVNVAIPLTTLPIIALGGYYYATDKESNVGKITLYSGIGLFLGLEITYQSGRYLFKLW